MDSSRPHGDKLQALLNNDKLPASDRDRINQAIEKYHKWREAIARVPAGYDGVEEAVRLLNEYRMFLDIEVIFDSEHDFLYRQKGQLKIDNSVIEEFLSLLIANVFPDACRTFLLGSRQCFTGLYFTSTMHTASTEIGSRIKVKDLDFAISKRVYLMVSTEPTFTGVTERIETDLGYLCVECKTNLDKTMFQEACATAHDVKTGLPATKYLLLCEWLDMKPMSTLGTDIDEVLILRKAKRLSAQIRNVFAKREGRIKCREKYVQYLREHPFSTDVFTRFLKHVQSLIEDRFLDEQEVLDRGYF
jgi:hypothetical protein